MALWNSANGIWRMAMGRRRPETATAENSDEGSEERTATTEDRSAVFSFANQALSAMVRSTLNTGDPLEADLEVLQVLNRMSAANSAQSINSMIEFEKKEETKPVPIPTLSASSSAASSLDIDNLPIFSLDDVREHSSYDDAWMIIYDRVYNVTSFLAEHPGGCEVMLDYLGHDASLAFRSVGHSEDAMEMLSTYLVGILPKAQRMYKSTDSMAW